MRHFTADVLVVGAGPTGLTAASELARHGLTAEIVEARSGRDLHTKAISISASTLQTLDHMGVVDAFLTAGEKVADIVVHTEGRRFLHVDYGRLGPHAGAPYPFLLTLAQPDAEALLETHLGRFGIIPQRGLRLEALAQDAEGVRVQLKGEDGSVHERRYRFVVGCDGARSSVRTLIGAAFQGDAYDISFIHGDFSLDWSGRKDQVHYFVEAQRFGLIIPMAKGRHRIVAQVAGSDPAKDYPKPETSDFVRLLEEAGMRDFKLTNPEWISHARLYHLLADRIRHGRVFLAGDAFHLFSPIGGQGMNTGIQDAFNLAWKLAYVVKGQAPEALLDSYEAERLPVAAGLVKSGDASTQLLLGRTAGRPDLAAMQAALAPTLANRRAFRVQLPVAYSGLGQAYGENSPHYDALPKATRPLPARAGRRMPLIPPLLAEFRDHQHRLIMIGGDLAIQKRILALYGAWMNITVIDPDAEPEITAALEARPGDVFVVRPDRWTEYSAPLGDGEHLLRFLAQVYGVYGAAAAAANVRRAAR